MIEKGISSSLTIQRLKTGEGEGHERTVKA